jgi:dTDP-4-dehydrorhamnose 3,5-epimerase
MPFTFTPVKGPVGILVVESPRHADGRGWFEETYKRSEFAAAGIPPLIQENRSRSARGVVRGLHYQLPPAAQGKLVRCTAGAIFDVAVDIRRASPTFGRPYSTTLDATDLRSLWIPPGFAHGFQALEEETEVTYLVSAEYDAKAERRIHCQDPSLGIAWPIRMAPLAPKDAAAPRLAASIIAGDWT